MHELTFASTALMICVAAGAYLAGCCNGAIITSFLFYRDDIRRHGSHNAGLTNFYRVYGKKFAICVILVDMLKAFVAVKLGSARIRRVSGTPAGGRVFFRPVLRNRTHLSCVLFL
ncbi:MAG: glycerol-3-phosphate acyltransferase [Acutalibacteraceae bacterium]